MAKKKEASKPYYLDSRISLENLQNLPEGITPEDLFVSIVIGAVIAVGKAAGGMPMTDHSKLYRIRQDFLNAIKVGESDRIELQPEDFKFIMKNWNEYKPMPEMNEIVIRVFDNLKRCESEHDSNPVEAVS